MTSFQILANIDKRGLVKYFGSDEEALKRSNIKGTATIYPNHTISFEICPTGTINVWGSILRFTIGTEACTRPGDRSPGLWFNPNSLNLHLRYGTDADANEGIDKVTSPLETFKWSKIDLVLQKQSAREDDYAIVVFINGQFAMEKSLKGCRSWIKPEGTLHQVWTSDNFDPAAPALIRNLAVSTPLVGRTIAIYADTAHSFLFMNPNGGVGQWRSKTPTPATVSQCCFDGIKFKVVDAGGGFVGLWNILTKRFLGIQTGNGTVAAPNVRPNGDFEPAWTWEKFSITETPQFQGLYTFYVPSPVDYSLGVRPNDFTNYGIKGQYVPGWQYELFSIHVVA